MSEINREIVPHEDCEECPFFEGFECECLIYEEDCEKVFSFKLNKDYVSKYKNVRPDCGFTDAAGSSLGEITFLRTYSRKKEDGTKEQWYEVCERVINGMYSLQKDYAKANRLPWSDSKAQASAQEAFDRMFRFKWTPPGRGLWVMGTPLVNEHKNSAALQNCFAPDTKIITREGVRTLGELRGRSVEVWAAGDWRPGRVESFGVQPVQRVEFAPFGLRSSHRVVEVVTPDHRWELRDGSTTTNLKVGDVVPGAVVTNHEHDETGFLHGLMFADGSVNYRYANGDFGHMMRLCGDKERFKDRFDRYSYQPNCNGDPVVYHRAGLNMKELPSTEDPNYVRSFIQGWLEFDGSKGAISTQNEKAARWLEEHAAIGGFQVVGHTVLDNETNFGKRSAPLHRIKLTDTAGLWTVKSITPLGITTEVLCAVVDGFERFTLASGVYTSNCAFVSTGDMTRNDPAKPFKFLMEASMLGVGVGFDLKGA